MLTRLSFVQCLTIFLANYIVLKMNRYFFTTKIIKSKQLYHKS